MSLDKEKLYTLRWAAGEIYKKAIDERTKSLSLTQIEVSSDLLGEPIPEEFRTPEPPRNSPSDEAHMPKPISPIGEKLLWYPKAVIRKDLKMKAIGNYAKGYPQGAVVHFTAGQWDKGINSAIDSIAWGRDQGYLFFCISYDGQVIQTNPLNQWGHHCGTSKWKIDGVTRTSLSDMTLGIEICGGGRLEKRGSKFFTWFYKEIPKEQVRYVDGKDPSQEEGYYHMYSKAQEAALVDLLLWLKRNNPDVFNLDYVLGHCEISGMKGLGYWRKNDPGGALSMGMDKFRELLKNQNEGTR